jgi:hypothetical protein
MGMAKYAERDRILNALAVRYMDTLDPAILGELMIASKKILGGCFKHFGWQAQGWTPDDLLGEMTIVMQKLLTKGRYNPEIGAYGGYLYAIAKSVLITRGTHLQTMKHKAMYSVVSNHVAKSGETMQDFKGAEWHDDDTLNKMATLESHKNTMSALCDVCSVLELVILLNYMKTKNYDNVASSVTLYIQDHPEDSAFFTTKTIDYKTVDNAIARIKKKAARLKENDAES